MNTQIFKWVYNLKFGIIKEQVTTSVIPINLVWGDLLKSVHSGNFLTEIYGAQTAIVQVKLRCAISSEPLPFAQVERPHLKLTYKFNKWLSFIINKARPLWPEKEQNKYDAIFYNRGNVSINDMPCVVDAQPDLSLLSV